MTHVTVTESHRTEARLKLGVNESDIIQLITVVVVPGAVWASLGPPAKQADISTTYAYGHVLHLRHSPQLYDLHEQFAQRQSTLGAGPTNDRKEKAEFLGR